MDLLAKHRERLPPIIRLMGCELTSVALDRVTAEMTAREELGNGVGILHGGAYMTFADFLGALGTVVNLPKGASTTTVESKTNFFAPAKMGTKVFGEAIPLHRGRRTMVWQTRLTNAEGRMLAMVTQTQMVLMPEPKPAS
jgi:uncharacterized protein (TIGR00369 family)